MPDDVPNPPHKLVGNKRTPERLAQKSDGTNKLFSRLPKRLEKEHVVRPNPHKLNVNHVYPRVKKRAPVLPLNANADHNVLQPPPNPLRRPPKKRAVLHLRHAKKPPLVRKPPKLPPLIRLKPHPFPLKRKPAPSKPLQIVLHPVPP